MSPWFFSHHTKDTSKCPTAMHVLMMSHSQVASHLRRLHALGRSVGFRTSFVFHLWKYGMWACINMRIYFTEISSYIIHTYETRFACYGYYVHICLKYTHTFDLLLWYICMLLSFDHLSGGEYKPRSAPKITDWEGILRPNGIQMSPVFGPQMVCLVPTDTFLDHVVHIV